MLYFFSFFCSFSIRVVFGFASVKSKARAIKNKKGDAGIYLFENKTKIFILSVFSGKGNGKGRAGERGIFTHLSRKCLMVGAKIPAWAGLLMNGLFYST